MEFASMGAAHDAFKDVITEIGAGREFSPAHRATCAAVIEYVLARKRVLMPPAVRDACKRRGLPYRTALFVDDVLALVCAYGEGRLALTYAMQELRDKGWCIPSRWDQQVALLEDHGFTLVQNPARKYAYYLAI